MGFMVLEEGLIEGFLSAMPLVLDRVDALPTLDLWREAVFLMPLWPVVLGLLSMLVPSDSSMGSQKVTPLAVFLLLLGEGECYMVYMGSGCQVGNIKLYNT